MYGKWDDHLLSFYFSVLEDVVAEDLENEVTSTDDPERAVIPEVVLKKMW